MAPVWFSRVFQRNRKHAPNGITVQLLSDLHLEAFGLYDSFRVPPTGRYLLLGGDIGKLLAYDRLQAFLQRQCSAFERVFLVLGNHEFYGTTRENALLLAQRMVSEPDMAGKLALLNRTRFDLSENVTLLGCTLQSHVPHEARQVVQRDIQDFKHIEGWTIDHHNEEHVRDVAWLKSELSELARTKPARKVIIATHHAPLVSGTSDPKHEGQLRSTAFATDVLGEAQSWAGIQNVKVWMFGHTHWCCDFVSHGVRVVANQHGYFPQTDTTRGLETKTARSNAASEPSTTALPFDVRKCITIEN